MRPWPAAGRGCAGGASCSNRPSTSPTHFQQDLNHNGARARQSLEALGLGEGFQLLHRGMRRVREVAVSLQKPILIPTLAGVSSINSFHNVDVFQGCEASFKIARAKMPRGEKAAQT